MMIGPEMGPQPLRAERTANLHFSLRHKNGLSPFPLTLTSELLLSSPSEDAFSVTNQSLIFCQNLTPAQHATTSNGRGARQWLIWAVSRIPQWRGRRKWSSMPHRKHQHFPGQDDSCALWREPKLYWWPGVQRPVVDFVPLVMKNIALKYQITSMFTPNGAWVSRMLNIVAVSGLVAIAFLNLFVLGNKIHKVLNLQFQIFCCFCQLCYQTAATECQRRHYKGVIGLMLYWFNCITAVLS